MYVQMRRNSSSRDIMKRDHKKHKREEGGRWGERWS